MNAREKKLLEAVFSAEVRSAVSENHPPHVYQTKSKLAQKLERDGLIRKAVVTMPGRFSVQVEGYELTEAGRLVYCATC